MFGFFRRLCPGKLCLPVLSLLFGGNAAELPQVGIYVSTPEAHEGILYMDESGPAQQSVAFTLFRSEPLLGKPLSTPLPVLVAYAGTATEEGDFNAATNTIIQPGSSLTVRLPVLADEEMEQTETIEVRLLPSTNYIVSSFSNIVLKIINVPPPRKTLDIYGPEERLVVQRPRLDFSTRANFTNKVAKAQFFNGPYKLGEVRGTNAVYSLTWRNPPIGEHGIHAKLADGKGGIVESQFWPIPLLKIFRHRQFPDEWFQTGWQILSCSRKRDTLRRLAFM